MQSHKVTMLGTGLITEFCTMTLHAQRSRDRVHDGNAIVKEELLPDGRRKLILSDRDTGSIFDLVTEG